jgi:hypothetical protein
VSKPQTTFLQIRLSCCNPEKIIRLKLEGHSPQTGKATSDSQLREVGEKRGRESWHMNKK